MLAPHQCGPASTPAISLYYGVDHHVGQMSSLDGGVFKRLLREKVHEDLSTGFSLHTKSPLSDVQLACCALSVSRLWYVEMTGVV